MAYSQASAHETEQRRELPVTAIRAFFIHSLDYTFSGNGSRLNFNCTETVHSVLQNQRSRRPVRELNSGRTMKRTLSLVLLFLLISPVTGDEPRLQIGQVAPAWKNLPATNGKTYSLTDFDNIDVLVVCFTSNTCLYSQDYEGRMALFSNAYSQAGASVKLIAVNSSPKPSDSIENMKRRAEEKKYPYLYLADHEQTLARSWGAIFTPEFFVLNKSREIVFIGAMDDHTMEDKVTRHHLNDAVDAALMGTLPKVTTVPARGCRIPVRRSRRQKP